MKRTLIVAAAAAAAFTAPALAQTAVAGPGYCTNLYRGAECRNPAPGNPYTDGRPYGDWRNANGAMSPQADEPAAHRYHGGPKYND